MTNKDQNKVSDQPSMNTQSSSYIRKSSSKLESQGHLNSLKNGLKIWNIPSITNTLFSRDLNSRRSKNGSSELNFKTSKNLIRNSLNTNTKSSKGDTVSVTYEEIGLWPRSFSRVLDRFLKQVFSDVENLVIQEYRFYRYLFLTTVRCLCILFFVPLLVNFFAKNYLIHPLTEYFWNTKQGEIFLNSYQQKRAFSELKEFEEKLYFESFIPSHISFGILTEGHISMAEPYLLKNRLEKSALKTTRLNSSLAISNSSTLPDYVKESKKKEGSFTNESVVKTQKIFSRNTQLEDHSTFSRPPLVKNGLENRYDNEVFFNFKHTSNAKNQGEYRQVIQKFPGTFFANDSSNNPESNLYKQRLQDKTVEIAIRYNEQSIEAITNLFADLLSFLTLSYLLINLEIQINITKSFLLEVFFGLDDSKKSLFILLVTDLLVGYHSSNIWELFFEFLFNHYGLPESQTGIFLLVATLPVLLDVLFKYLIFRHLNRSSPATVATYHAMIE